MVSRRSVLAAGAALATIPLTGCGRNKEAVAGQFPKGFLWGASTAGHQVEGNSTNSDLWFLEHQDPTNFAEPSGDACNSLELWPRDLDIVRDLGLNSFRFSIEWARIEPEPGRFSAAMLDHYLRIVEGCRARNLSPVVTFNHFVTPRWFAARGGWTNPESSVLFARFCERAARHLGAQIEYAVTLNEPQLARLLEHILPPFVWNENREVLNHAAQRLGVEKFSTGNVVDFGDLDVIEENLLLAHRRGRDVIKSVQPQLPVGVSIAITDDEAVGSTVHRDAKRESTYRAWLEVARDDDFLGVQNYARERYDENGKMDPPADARKTSLGEEIYPPSLANAVSYAHSETGVPILVTEHGVSADDDAVRQWLLPAALEELKATMDSGVPVLGYLHWSLLDSFEWVFGYGPKLGLVAVDRETFERRPKPSATLYGEIARRNAL